MNAFQVFATLTIFCFGVAIVSLLGWAIHAIMSADVALGLRLFTSGVLLGCVALVCGLAVDH